MTDSKAFDDIDRAAWQLLKQHPEYAKTQARMNLDTAREKDDLEAAKVWVAILHAVELLVEYKNGNITIH